MNFIPVNTPLITEQDAKLFLKLLKWLDLIIRKNIKLFENNLSKFINRKFGCAVSNGTAALEIAVKFGLKKMMKLLFHHLLLFLLQFRLLKII